MEQSPTSRDAVPSFRSAGRVLVGALAALALALPGGLPGAEPGRPKFVLAWGKKGDKPGEFYSPIGIAVSKKDEV